MRLLLSVFFLMWVLQTSADAGFSVRRKKAVSIVKLTGLENLKSGKLIDPRTVYDTTGLRPWEKLGKVIDNDFETSIQEQGGRWRETQRDLNFIFVDTATGRQTDSLHLFAKDYNLTVNFISDKNGKLQYRIDSSKALYQYSLTDEATPDTFGRNRYIFIGCSVAGLLLLIILFLRKKNKTINPSL